MDVQLNLNKRVGPPLGVIGGPFCFRPGLTEPPLRASLQPAHHSKLLAIVIEVADLE